MSGSPAGDAYADYQPGIANNLKYDLPAGLVVCLVALPLCLGIALASGAPLFSGLIAGLVGGIVVGVLSGSDISVSGPAAGLAVIVASAIQELGSFQLFLLAVALSGVVQLVLGVLRAGIIGNYVPNAVIKGMLAAIGVVIILKQIPHALGRDADFEGDFDFFQTAAGTSNTFLDIVRAVYTASPAAVVISVLSLALLLLWERPAVQRQRLLKLVPGPLLVVVLGVVCNELFRAAGTGLELLATDGHLVSIPVAGSVGEFLGQFTRPDWAGFANSQVYATALTLAAVGSVETLLSIEAADKLDPFRRISDTNKELRAQGVGNLLSGLIGGLPITAVIVRSSANVYAGARTRLSAIVHGVLLLACVAAIPALLNRIPLASLAAILLMIGYKLTKLGLYRTMYAAGWDQFFPFLVTVLAVVFTDLLTGIGIGLVVGFFFVIRDNHHAAFTLVHQDRYHLLRINKDASFVNKNELKEMLTRIPDGAALILDGGRASYIDGDIYDVVTDFQRNAAYRHIEIEFKNFHDKSRARPRGGR
jgi:MFS superfamily sulfate permease-like transporter